jgi:hypothetical protein
MQRLELAGDGRALRISEDHDRLARALRSGVRAGEGNHAALHRIVPLGALQSAPPGQRDGPELSVVFDPRRRVENAASLAVTAGHQVVVDRVRQVIEDVGRVLRAGAGNDDRLHRGQPERGGYCCRQRLRDPEDQGGERRHDRDDD